MRQVFDDGTYLDTDASGAVTAYTDTSGRVYGADTSVMDSFLRSIAGSLTQAIDRRLNPAPVAPVVSAPLASSANLQKIIIIVLVAGGAFALYKAAK